MATPKIRQAGGSKRGPKPTLVNPRKVNFWIEMEDFEKLRLLAYWHSSDVATEIRRIVIEHLRKHPPKPISPA